MNMKLGEALKNKIETELEKKSVKKVDFMVLCEVYSQAKKQIQKDEEDTLNAEYSKFKSFQIFSYSVSLFKYKTKTVI